MYAERATGLPHVTAWRSVAEPGAAPARILPDGCLDVIWRDGSLFVAGPDTTAWSERSAGRAYFALRLGGGVGPRVLGVPADELTDSRVPLGDLVPARQVRALADAPDPAAALADFARRRWRRPDPAVLALAAGARAGRPVSAIAEMAGLSPRHLQRLSRSAFGYGPRTLVRIFRMRRAVALARAGRQLAEVSAVAGYADQAHLAREVRALAGVPMGQLLA